MSLRLRTDDLEWKEIDGEIVALDARDAKYLTVRGSGALLWGLLATVTTRAALVRALVDAYAIDGPQADADVDRFLAELDEQGLLEA